VRVLGVDLGNLVQTILFLLFAGLTAIVAAIIGPTYDNLLVPELSPGALYPAIGAPGSDPNNFLATAAHFSTYLLANVVDPAITLVGVGIAVAYLSKALLARWSAALDGLLVRLILAVIAANFTVPIAGAILGVAGGLYPVVAGWDGGAWQHWVNLAGYGEVAYSWDNGALAFVLSLVEFAAVFALVLAVGLRDALLAVLIVVLPILTLLWPFRPLSPLARRAWFLFAELAFLPCVLVIPLELAVNSPNPVLLVGYLASAVASPYLLSLAGTHLVAFGFPSGNATVQSGAQRGLAVAPRGAGASFGPAAETVRSQGSAGRAAWGATRVAGSAAAPAAAPLAVAEVLGHAGLHLARHVRRGPTSSGPPSGWRPIRGGGTG
jgi:hypothetical protein